jgi:arylsulfatase A-like enzyme
VTEHGAAIDLFPTILRAAEGDAARYELDGLDVLRMIADGAPSPHDDLFWEMGRQTAIRRGRWKLVLNGQLVESDRTGTPIEDMRPEDAVFLADLVADPDERTNLRDRHPEIAGVMRAAAEAWRAGIEERWQREWRGRTEETGVTGWTAPTT